MTPEITGARAEMAQVRSFIRLNHGPVVYRVS